MKDAYKVDIIDKHLKAQAEDEYYLVQVTGSAGKNINLDKEALLLLKEYYEGRNDFQLKSAEEVIASRDENNYVEGYVQIHISEMIDNDYEAFLDAISEELVGSDLLMDVNYDVVGLADEPNELILKVSGDASAIVESEEE